MSADMNKAPCPYWGLADHSRCLYCNPKPEAERAELLATLRDLEAKSSTWLTTHDEGPGCEYNPGARYHTIEEDFRNSVMRARATLAKAEERG